MWRTRDWDALWTWLPSNLQWNSGVCCQENQASCPWRFPSHLYSGPTRGLWLVGQTGKQTRSLHGYLSGLAIINSHPSQEETDLRIRAIVVSATSTDSSSGSSWIPFGKRRFSMITVTSLVSVSYSKTLTPTMDTFLYEQQDMKTLLFHRRLPSISCRFHNEVHIILTLPPAAGVCKIHLLPVLCHR